MNAWSIIDPDGGENIALLDTCSCHLDPGQWMGYSGYRSFTMELGSGPIEEQAFLRVHNTVLVTFVQELKQQIGLAFLCFFIYVFYCSF